jgi:membrane protease YdiL (CAAX protease family)
MKRCTYCGKEYSDEISQCPVDGQPVAGSGETIVAAVLEPPPIIASVPTRPRLGARLTDRQLRIIEICIVCLVAFAGSILASFYVLWNPSGYPVSSGPYKWISNTLRASLALILLWYVLLRRSKGFSDIGLSWKGKSDFGWSIVLSVAGSAAFNILYAAIYYSGLSSTSRAETSSHVGHLLFSGGIAFATIAYQFVNPFFEELIVRAYVMTEVEELTKSATKAIVISTILQTSYHFYQGVPAALGHAATFLVFSIYYAKTKRILPVILAHLYADLGGTLWYMYHHHLATSFAS